MIETSMLGLEGLLVQQVVIERDAATEDAYGAKAARDWQPLDPIPGFMWWGTGASVSRMGSLRARPEATVDLNTGGIILPADADVTGHDRVAQVLDANGGTLAEGPFEILSVSPFEGLTELSFRRIT